MPNVLLGRKRIELQLKELETNIFRMDIRLLELDDEREKVLHNKDATTEAIQKLRDSLGGN